MHINVIFQPTGRRGKICSGKTILEACQKFGINLESPCGGMELVENAKLNWRKYHAIRRVISVTAVFHQLQKKREKY